MQDRMNEVVANFVIKQNLNYACYMFPLTCCLFVKEIDFDCELSTVWNSDA